MAEVIEQVPKVINIALRRGDSLGLALQVWDDPDETVPSDLSTTVVQAQSREDPDGPLLGDWEVAVNASTIDLVLPAKVSQALPELSYWDCQIDWYADGLTVTTIVAGAVSAAKDVTHE